MLHELLDFITPLLPWLALVSLASIVLVAVAVPLVVIELPPDYFTRDQRAGFALWARHPLLRASVLAIKNVVALLFILVGLVLLFLPGQGMLTIIVGVLLLDFPGKYRFERWLMCRPRIQRLFNRLRGRAGKPPFVTETRIE